MGAWGYGGDARLQGQETNCKGGASKGSSKAKGQGKGYGSDDLHDSERQTSGTLQSEKTVVTRRWNRAVGA